MTTPSQVIALLNALTLGDLDGHAEVAALVAEANAALSGGDLRTYRKKVETAVARLGHLR